MTLNKTYVDNAEQFHNSHAYFSLPIENVLYTYYFSAKLSVVSLE